MSRATITLAVLLIAALGFAAACGGEQEPADNKDKQKAQRVTRPDVPAEYQGKVMPADVSLESGAKIFADHCASCHGPKGDGDSPTGRALRPPANDLTDPALHAAVEDDYLYWRIKEGGAFPPFNSGMESFKDRLDEEQTWQVIAYIRGLKR